MPLIIRIEAVGLEEGEQPSIARNMAADQSQIQPVVFVDAPVMPIVPPPFLTDTLVLSQ